MKNRRSIRAAAFMLLVFVVLMYSPVFAWSPSNYAQSSRDVGTFSENISQYIMTAVLALFFVGGAVLTGMGIFAAVNKDSNPQGAAGAWKKIAGGAALLAFTVLLGVLRSTILGAG